MLYGFTEGDLEKLREHKDREYRKGRGRKGQPHKLVFREQNKWKAHKGLLSRNVMDENLKREALKEARVERRELRDLVSLHRKITRKLRKRGYYLFCPTCNSHIEFRL